jgi:(S)-ureidoglycine aminohydrolase
MPADFGVTRGARGPSYTLITPANHYVSRLPQFAATTVVELVTPRLAPARLGQYLLELAPGGGGGAPVPEPLEHFLYGLEGGATLTSEGTGHTLDAGAFAYLPAGSTFHLEAGDRSARLLWIKRRYEPWPGLEPPAPCFGHRDQVTVGDVGVRGLRRRELLPAADPAFDFTMSLLAFDPGVALDRVEIHDEEHGLYMTAGEGVYVLDGTHHTVREGDFIYMAPYCPQTFVSTGAEPAEYLLYKDVFRDGF